LVLGAARYGRALNSSASPSVFKRSEITFQRFQSRASVAGEQAFIIQG
jgi:hypothetical protein